MSLDPAACYRALCARDERFDGLFFVAVKTTGIYCRPVCRARTPASTRCVFYHHAAQAERDGFRACFRCRPELAPGKSPQEAIPRLAARAVARIDARLRDGVDLDALAADLGVSARHLRRAVHQELGVPPVAIVQSRRMALAKQLLQDTHLPMIDVAFASGFASVRRFNALFAARFGRPPSTLRREHRGEAPGAATGALTLRLDYRPPLDWGALLDFLAARAIPGVEVVTEGSYRRTVRCDAGGGWLTVQRDRGAALRVELSLSLVAALPRIVAGLRALFDLDAHPTAIAEHLGADQHLGAQVRARPGLRVPGAFDGFETTTRALLGQQVSVRAATTLSGRVVAALGDLIETPYPGLTRLFPRAETLAAAPEELLAACGLPRARARALIALAAACEAGLGLERTAEVPATTAALLALPGIGDWTAQYVGMRVLGWPDAFPAGDLALRAALGGVTPREAAQLSERWRPWRAYAAMYLWTSLTKGA